MVANYLLGNKEGLAIEFNLQSERLSHHLFGGIRIWLGGSYIGAYEDVNILSVTLHELEKLLTGRDIYSKEFEGLDEKDIFCLIKSEDNLDGGRYYFSPGEAFDDFSIVVYRYDGSVRFIWKLRENPTFQYHDYPMGIQSAMVAEDELREITAQFRMQLDELSKLVPIIPRTA